MNTSDGTILMGAEIDKALEDPTTRPFIKPMEILPTEKQFATGKVGRNDPCPCGSGIKFKKCCLHPRFD